MIDLKDLRDHPDKYRTAAQQKRINVDIDRLLALDAQRRQLDSKRQQLAAEKNQIGKQIGQLAVRLKKATGEEQAKLQAEMKHLQARPTELKAAEQELDTQLAALEPEIEYILLRIPQPPDADVPIGKDAGDNVVVRIVGEPTKFDFKPKSHAELGATLGIIDVEAGVKIAGSRSYYLKGLGAELHQAILRFAFEMMTREKGFTALNVPLLVREPAMRGTGFFPAGKDQTYHVDSKTDDELFLVGTSEVGLVAYHMDQILDEAQLPLKYTAISTCFRREAGTYGRDTAGIYRVHQFDKCEQVVICRNDVDESKRLHMEMLGYSEELLQRLKLPYRVINCCTGDIGVKNASMYDIETWMPSRFDGKDPATGYGETHSASRLYDFQARRLNLRYRQTDGKTIKFCHTLNNTVAASPRLLIAILENCQNADGTITIPDVLRPYMNNREMIRA
jgi:seryl-tRNA synthetase